jgi:hypothetical protein
MERIDAVGVVIKIKDAVVYVGKSPKILKGSKGVVLEFKLKNVRVKWEEHRVERTPQDENDVSPKSLQVIKD